VTGRLDKARNGSRHLVPRDAQCPGTADFPFSPVAIDLVPAIEQSSIRRSPVASSSSRISPAGDRTPGASSQHLRGSKVREHLPSGVSRIFLLLLSSRRLRRSKARDTQSMRGATTARRLFVISAAARRSCAGATTCREIFRTRRDMAPFAISNLPVILAARTSSAKDPSSCLACAA